MGPQVLYQGLERLEKEKADREHLEMEIDVVSISPREPPCLLPPPAQEVGVRRDGADSWRNTLAPALFSGRKQIRALWRPK